MRISHHPRRPERDPRPSSIVRADVRRRSLCSLRHTAGQGALAPGGTPTTPRRRRPDSRHEPGAGPDQRNPTSGHPPPTPTPSTSHAPSERRPLSSRASAADQRGQRERRAVGDQPGQPQVAQKPREPLTTPGPTSTPTAAPAAGTPAPRKRNVAPGTLVSPASMHAASLLTHPFRLKARLRPRPLSQSSVHPHR